MEEAKTITIENVVYDIKALPSEVAKMVLASQTWVQQRVDHNKTIADSQLEINKINAALITLSNEIIRLVKESGVKGQPLPLQAENDDNVKHSESDGSYVT